VGEICKGRWRMGVILMQEEEEKMIYTRKKK
jgi:hypothetical protein